jgi:hypothetical protein
MRRCCILNVYPPPECDPRVNIAEQVIEWLRTEQLQAGEQWSYLLPTGFSWWAEEYLQTIEFLGEETGPLGETGYLVCVRTEMLRDLDLSVTALEQINSLPMRCAALAGPVYDVAARRLDLWSLVRLTDDNGAWMRYLLSAAAVTQLAEARMLAPLLAGAVGARTATSEHPESGPRTVADQMAYAAGIFVRSGDEPCAWPEAEFRDTVIGHMNGPPAMVAGVEGRGFTVEFPFGAQTSLCRVLGDQSHPLYGNGLLILQRFPIEVASESDGIRLALSLNAADLTTQVTGYGLGSYSYADGAIHFSGFVPNALHKPGLLPNLYSSCAARAQAMAARFTEGGWDADAFSLDATVLARRADERREAAPVVERPIRGCPMMQARGGK